MNRRSTMTTAKIEDGTSQPRPRARRRWAWMLLAAPLLLGGVTYTAAEAHGFGHGEMHDRMQARMQHILNDVGATDAQKAQIKTIWDNLRPQLKAARQDHGRLRGQIA